MLKGFFIPHSEHPCISLRLHNNKKPINILTGMDYWLDNLMCQVQKSTAISSRYFGCWQKLEKHVLRFESLSNFLKPIKQWMLHQ